jgi:hypothetical protein
MLSPIEHPRSSHHQRQNGVQSWSQFAHLTVQRHRMLIWAVAAPLVMAAVPLVIFATAERINTVSQRPSHMTSDTGPGMSSQPADQFMQSVVTQDGALGWRQLCPSLQTLLRLDTMVQQTNVQRADLAQQSVRLTVAPVGARLQKDGGIMHVYMVTAQWPSGATQTNTYNVLTQPSGCVEDVQHS